MQLSNSDVMKKINKRVAYTTHGGLLLICVASLALSLQLFLVDPKKDEKVIEHANIFNPHEFSILSYAFVSFIAFVIAKTLLHMTQTYRNCSDKELDEEESDVWEYMRHFTTLTSLVAIFIVNGILRTPSTIHQCPLINTTAAGCDILDLEYDDNIVQTWSTYTTILAVLICVIKLSDLVVDFRFDLSKLLVDNRKGDNKTLLYLISVLACMVLATISLFISESNDVKESLKYEEDSTLDWVIFFSLTALVAHSILLIVTISARYINIRCRLSNMNGIIVTSIFLIAAIVSLVLLLTEKWRGYIVFIIGCGILALMFFLHLACRPKKDIQIDIIAANEIPFTRGLVVLTQLSLLSYINGVLIAYQIDITFSSAALVFVVLADILGKNEF